MKLGLTRASSSIHFLPPKGHRARALAFVILAAAPFAFGALVILLGQDANWDLRNYHWYNAYAFLNGRYGVDLLPSQTPWFYNPLIDVPFYLLAMHVPAVVAGFALGFVQGLNFPLLFMLAHATLIITNPRYKVIVCAFLAALGMLGGGGIALLGTTFYDNVTSLGLFASALLALRYFNDVIAGEWRRAFLTALLIGIPAGLMMGLKLPSVIFCLGLCGAFLFAGGLWHRRLMASFAFGLGVLLGTAITLSYWAWFLDTHFGSPLFPYFNELFKSPLAPLTSARDTQYVTRSVKDFLLFPFVFAASPYRVGEIPWRDWRIPILYVLLPLAIILRLLFGRSRQDHHAIALPYAARYLLAVGAISYSAWLAIFCIYRYAVPLEMLTPLLIVLAAGVLPLKAAPRALLTAFILLVVAASVQPGNWYRRAAWSDRYVAAGIPPLGDTLNLMILMAGFEPYAHVVTQFPPEVPIVRVQSNFASPDEDKGINKLIHERVDRHKGRFMLLIPPWQHGFAEEALRAFRLAPEWRSCQKVIDRLYDDKVLDLCAVRKVGNHG
jgi:hypothetical protein